MVSTKLIASIERVITRSMTTTSRSRFVFISLLMIVVVVLFGNSQQHHSWLVPTSTKTQAVGVGLFVKGHQQQPQQPKNIRHHHRILSSSSATLPLSSTMSTTISSTPFRNTPSSRINQRKKTTTTTTTIGSSIATTIPRGGGSILGKSTKQGRTKATISQPSSSPSTKNNKVATTTVVGTGTASMTVEVFNLVKNIVGVAVLSLPASIATFGDETSVLVPALGYITIMGMLSGYGFATIGKVCSYTHAVSYSDAWSKTIGSYTSWIPAVSATSKTFATCMAISMVLTDTFGTLLGRTRPNQRTSTLIGLTLSMLVPLCWMKNLSSLAPFSIIGTLGMAFTALAMTVRYVDGSYGTAGTLLKDVATKYRPLFGTRGWKSSYQSPAVLLLLCTLSTAYMAHFNAPKFYLELYNNTIERYNTMVMYAFGASIVLMGYITAIGFLTFGKGSASVILNNYSSNDVWMSASRIAVAISLVFLYPLAFQGCRDGILDLMKVSKKDRTNPTLNITTIVMLTVITLMAATLQDVGLVLAVGGATLGNALSYIYPALMYTAVVQKQKRQGETFQLLLSIGSAVIGTIMGVIGTVLALQKK